MNREGMKARPDDERLLRYLLDEASDDERAAVEREFLADDERYLELEALEDELRHDYLRGDLSPSQKGRFEARFLASAADREKLEQARDVLAALDRGVPGRPRSTARMAPARWLAAAAVVCLCAGTWAVTEVRRVRARVEELAAGRAAAEGEWARRLAEEKGRADALARDLRGEQERRSALEGELSRLEAAGSSPRHLVAVLLAPGLTRGAEVPTATLGHDASLRLSLRLPSGQEGARFQAEIRGAGGPPVWSGRDLVRRDAASGPVVILTVPGRRLPEGEYEVTLSTDGRAADEEVADYHFAVTRR